jgi:hypothetical protein
MAHDWYEATVGMGIAVIVGHMTHVWLLPPRLPRPWRRGAKGAMAALTGCLAGLTVTLAMHRFGVNR